MTGPDGREDGRADLKTILLVEDEEDVFSFLSEWLSMVGFRCSRAPDGEAAIEALEESRFDLVLLDLMLPGMSGMAVLERMRLSGSSVPVIVVSARAFPEDMDAARRLGARAYVTKPFEPSDILDRISEVLGEDVSAPTNRNK